MKNRSALIFGIIALFLLGAYAYVNFFGRNKTSYWGEYYSEGIQQPYSLSLEAALLKEYFPGKKFVPVEKDFPITLEEQNNKSGNYIFIGEKFYIAEGGADTLLQFIEKGNNALIVSKTLPYRLIFKLFKGNKYCQQDDYNGEEALFAYLTEFNFLHPDLKFQDNFLVEHKTLYKEDRKRRRWNYIPAQYLCEEGFQPVGTIQNKHINFAYINYGKGRVYFHTNPIVFTNYYLIQEKGKQYFDGVMAHLKEDNIYYDISARIPKEKEDFRNQRHQAKQGPLSYILSQRSLAAAWYMLLLMGILFLIFRSKRKQRVIPIKDKNENTSLTFIQNISNLYFQQANNKELTLNKFTYFLEFIRTKYNITLRDDDQFERKLAQKSGISPKKIKELLTMYKNIEATSFLGDKTMTRFVLLINHFYKNCK